jgi:hypothetical protein
VALDAERYVIDLTVTRDGVRHDRSTMRIKPMSLSAHGAIEILAGLAMILLPAVLGFNTGATIVAASLGAVLAGAAIALTTQKPISVAAFSRFDGAYLLVTALAAFGLAVTGELAGAVLLSGVVMLLSWLGFSTRYAATA